MKILWFVAAALACSSAPAAACARFPTPVVFAPASSELSEAAKRAIEKAAEDYRQTDGIEKIVIRSILGAQGSPDLRAALAKRRAMAVRDILAGYGVPMGQVEIVPPPISPPADAQAYPDEEGVEIILVPTQKAIDDLIKWREAEIAAGRPIPLC